MTELRVEAKKRRYRVLQDVTVSFGDGTYSQGDELEAAFDADDEWRYVDSALLALLPDWYEVIGDSSLEVNLVEAPASRTTRTVQPGEQFQASIPLAREEQLRYHIRRIQPPKKSPTKE